MCSNVTLIAIAAALVVVLNAGIRFEFTNVIFHEKIATQQSFPRARLFFSLPQLKWMYKYYFTTQYLNLLM